MKKLPLLALTSLLLSSLVLPAWGGPVLERIRETGVITAGARRDAVPFAFVDSQGRWVGYSIDMLERIRRQAEKQLGKPIQLKLVEATPEERFNLIQANKIDIECASSTFTWARTQKVDFSVSYFADGTKILTRANSGLESAASLNGRAVGVIPNSTNEKAIKVLQPAANLVPLQDQAEGIAKLEAGEIEAFAGDGIVLEGLRQKLKKPQDWAIVPNFPYQYESYACLLPKDDSDWRNLVNYALIQYMEGVVSDQTAAVAVYEKWFGEEGLAPYPRDTVNDYFQGIVDGFEWIPIIDY
ncbi:MAG: transporter substrate-binding domain-containing protein [Cyanobacteria bacterium RI_101]|nr:transporter substrate-binding domain-containing protein [Cyanobacteria bacterium RI_101]